MNKRIKRVINGLVMASILGSNIMFTGCVEKNVTNDVEGENLVNNGGDNNNKEAEGNMASEGTTEENEMNKTEENKDKQSEEVEINTDNSSENINVSNNSKEYLSNTPQMVDNIVCISPKRVYYSNGKLVMNAFVYNGFDYEIFNINNINIKLGNGEELIAEAGFGELDQVKLGSKSYIEWTFTFNKDAVIINDSDLSDLTWETNCSYSYQSYYLVKAN